MIYFIKRLSIYTVLMGTLLLGFTAFAEAINLYSVDKLDDAVVYLSGDRFRTAGEVEDVLFDDQMRIKALVMDLDRLPGMDHDRVVDIKDVKIETINAQDLKHLSYRIILQLNEQQVQNLPLFDRQWWSSHQ